MLTRTGAVVEQAALNLVDEKDVFTVVFADVISIVQRSAVHRARRYTPLGSQSVLAFEAPQSEPHSEPCH